MEAPTTTAFFVKFVMLGLLCGPDGSVPKDEGGERLLLTDKMRRLARDRESGQRTVEIGESLAQVHRLVLLREAGHLGEDRLAERLKLPGDHAGSLRLLDQLEPHLPTPQFRAVACPQHVDLTVDPTLRIESSDDGVFLPTRGVHEMRTEDAIRAQAEGR